MPGAKEILEKIIEYGSTNNLKRSEYNAKYEFLVNMDYILYIENRGYHSFTFLISRPEENGLLENLALCKEDDGYVARIYSYNVSQREREMILAGEPVLLETPILTTELPDFDSSDILNRSTCFNVTEQYVAPCGSKEHHSGNSGDWHRCVDPIKPNVLIVTRSICIETGEPGTGGGLPGNPGGGGGGNGNYNPNIPPYNPDRDFGIVQGNITRPFLTLLTSEQKFYNSLDLHQKLMMNDKEMRTAILGLLTTNNYSAEAIDFAKRVLSVLSIRNLSKELGKSLLNFVLISPENLQAAQDILDFLMQDNSNERIDFVEQFITEANETGLTLDFNKSFKSPYNIDITAVSGNTPQEIRFRSIYNKVLESPKFKRLFVDLFSDDPRFSVNFKINNIPPDAQGRKYGSCRLFTNTVTGKLRNEIIIDKYSLTIDPDDVIAVTIIHESIHAFLNVKFRHPTVGMPISDINNMDFTQCINQYFNGFSGGESQHDFFVYYMAPIIKDILQEISPQLYTPHQVHIAENPTYDNGGSIIYAPMDTVPPSMSANPVPWNWDDYFTHLSYIGLKNCSSFSIIYPHNSVEYYYWSSYLAAGIGMFAP